MIQLLFEQSKVPYRTRGFYFLYSVGNTYGEALKRLQPGRAGWKEQDRTNSYELDRRYTTITPYFSSVHSCLAHANWGQDPFIHNDSVIMAPAMRQIMRQSSALPSCIVPTGQSSKILSDCGILHKELKENTVQTQFRSSIFFSLFTYYHDDAMMIRIIQFAICFEASHGTFLNKNDTSEWIESLESH